MMKKSSPESPWRMTAVSGAKVTGTRESATVIRSQGSRLPRTETRPSRASYFFLFLMVEPIRIRR